MNYNTQNAKIASITEKNFNGRICTQELKPKSWSGNRSEPLADFVIDESILACRKYEIMENGDADS